MSLSRICIRYVKDSGMVTEELAVKDRGVQSVKTASHMVRFHRCIKIASFSLLIVLA